MKKFRKFIQFAFLLGLGFTLFSGCRTAHGFGEDMQNAGQEIQKGTE